MWLTALIIGLAGSLHCLGMCSPLAFAVTNFRRPYFTNRLIYNGGRILCYGLLGMFFSTFGSLFRLSGFQNALTLTLGCALIVLGIAGTRYFRIPFLTPLVQKITASIKSLFAEFLQRKTTVSVAFLGALNGLLPCGLTYVALTYCLTLGSPIAGFAFMLVFGAGTLPVMLGLTSGMQFLTNRFHFSLGNFTTIAMIVLGALLMSRGMYVHSHVVRDQHPAGSIVICK